MHCRSGEPSGKVKPSSCQRPHASPSTVQQAQHRLVFEEVPQQRLSASQGGRQSVAGAAMQRPSSSAQLSSASQQTPLQTCRSAGQQTRAFGSLLDEAHSTYGLQHWPPHRSATALQKALPPTRQQVSSWAQEKQLFSQLPLTHSWMPPQQTSPQARLLSQHLVPFSRSPFGKHTC